MAEQNTEKGTSTGLDVKLHPLVILNISDHWTRTMVSKNESQRVVGALLGTQTGRNVEIHTSFELIILEENGIETLDATYLEDKKGHYSAVFPTYELVGWYTTGKEMQISFHKVLMRYNESPLLLQMDTHPPEDCRTLPIWIHETVVQGMFYSTFLHNPFVFYADKKKQPTNSCRRCSKIQFFTGTLHG